MVQLGFESLDFLEVADKGGAGRVAIQVGHVGGRAGKALGPHEVVQLPHGGLQLLDDYRRLILSLIHI